VKSDGRRPTVTMEDVAARAGVSRALVSIVFRGVPGASAETRKRVMEAAEELSYRPDQRARLLGSNRSRTVGVAFGLHHEFHAELVEQLYRAAEGSGYELALGAVAPSRDESRAVQGLLDYRCEAVVLLGSGLSRHALAELAVRLPVVVLVRSVRAAGVDVVRTDDAAGARLAVRHLLDLGHEDVVHVHGGRAPGAAERRRGYLTEMRTAGLADRTRLIPGGLTEDDGEAAAALLGDPGRPTAVTVFNDHCAAGLIAALRGDGIEVPGDLSVVGYDDSHIAGLKSLALTTIAQDAPSLAGAALSRALWRIDDQDGATTAGETVIPPRLVTRSTTAGP
jgi:DNA-binding LacI/PurR family transcriptional regulator